MFDLFHSKENKRIEELFNLFKVQIKLGIQKDSALMQVWGELTTRDNPLKNKHGYQERGIESKRKLLKEIFTPLDVTDYDIFKSIQFIVSWEFPQNYNHMPSIEDIRSGKDAQSILESKVRRIGEKIL